MDSPEHFERVQDYAVYRPVGRFSFEESVDLVCRAIALCREEKIGRVLVDATRMTGIPDLGPEDRFVLADQAARAAQAAVKVALVARETLLDPARFGMTVARNRGLFMSSFSSEPEALLWLLDPNAE